MNIYFWWKSEIQIFSCAWLRKQVNRPIHERASERVATARPSASRKYNINGEAVSSERKELLSDQRRLNPLPVDVLGICSGILMRAEVF